MKNPNRLCYILVTGCLLLSTFFSWATVHITNVNVIQREGSKTVDIIYDVSSSVADTVSISVLASNDSSVVNLTSLSGDIGSSVSTGEGKNIVWNGGADWNGNVSTGLYVTVVAEDEDFYPVKKLVRYSFTLTNEKGTTIPKAEFWVRVPVGQTANQRLSSLDISHSYELLEDQHGNQILYFCFNNFPPYGRTIIRFEARVGLTSEPQEVSIRPSDYLGAADYIEINNAEFQSLSPSFTAGPATQVAENIMNWVRNNVQDVGYRSRANGALYALKQKDGDGTEMMYLFVALCRENGIPARPMAGYVCTENAILHAFGYENWAEYFDGDKWQLVDAHARVFETRGDDYLAFTVAVDDGPLVHSSRFRVAGEGFTASMD